MQKPFLWVIGSLALLGVSGIASAQEADPPSRVARIAYMTGPVSFQPATVDQWADASLNYPLTTGDNLYTADGARAVLRIGQNSIRLNSGTNFQFVNLSDNIVQISINSGSVSLHVRHLFDGESWEVDTPNGAVTLLRPGVYRIDSDPNRNASMITTRTGDVEVTANNQSFAIHSGQTGYVDNSGNPPDIQEANQPDDFDNFVSSRDRVEDVPPPQYVSQDMVGYEDLQANGDWSESQDYGHVWYPRVAAGWTPYHDGRWAWVEPWGWTWVDDAPWGFAPFHYGRWAYVSNRWGWCPGPPAPRPYYAPALVAFVGGGGFSVGVSFGGGGGGGGLVGWFPLGPREQYNPSYHVSPTYVRQVNVTNTRITNINVTNVTNVTNITYVNRTAVVAVPQNAFSGAQSVQRTAVRVDPGQMRNSQVLGSAPRVAPQRVSILASVGTSRPVATPPAAFANRAVVARIAPPPRPVAFAVKQQYLQQHPGTPVPPQQTQTFRAQVAQQSPAPGRMQVQAINATQVRPIAPIVRPGAAPSFATRPAQPVNAPSNVPVNRAPLSQPQTPAQVQPAAPNQPVPVVRPQNFPPNRPQVQPPAPQQVQPPARQPVAPPVREQAPPPVRQQAPPPVREQAPPPVREQAQPPVRQQAPPPAREQALPPVREQVQPRPQAPPPVREQAPPPLREQVQPRPQAPPPVREQAPPPVREQVQPRPQAPPPVREQAPPPRPQAQPQRQPPPPQHRDAPPKQEEKRKDDKKE